MDDKKLFRTSSNGESKIKNIIKDTEIKEAVIKEPFLADDKSRDDSISRRLSSFVADEKPKAPEYDPEAELEKETQKAIEEAKARAARAEAAKAEAARAEAAKAEAARAEAAKAEAARAEAAKAEAARAEAARAEAARAEAARAEAARAEAARAEAARAEAAKVVEEPVVAPVQAPKVETPKAAEAEAPKIQRHSFLAEDTEEQKAAYMVRNFNMGKEEEDVDKDRFKLQKHGKATGKKGKKLITYQQRQNRLGYSFMSLWMIGFAIFTLIPFFFTIFMSLCNVKQNMTGFEFEFVGIQNYLDGFTKNTDLTPAIISYLQVIVPYTFIVVVLSFIIAYLLNKITVGKGVLRTVYFLPVIIMSGSVLEKVTAVNEAAVESAEKSGHVIVSDYSHIFIMQIIRSYSPELSLFLGSVFDKLSLILWFTGIPIVLFINALQKINVSIYEAAKIDSANAWQIMWKITIPMLRQIGLIVTVFTIVQLGMYKQVNDFYPLILDLTGQTNSMLGSAAAYAWVYSFVVLLLIGIVFFLFREKKGKRGA